MRMNLPVVAIAIGIAAPAVSPAQTVWGTYEQPLEGRRFETMRALANYLDESAHEAYDAAREDSRRGSRTARAVLPALRSFATLAANFHDRMDNYEAATTDVPDDVEALLLRARRIDRRVSTGRGFSSTAQIWPDVMDAVDRMRRLLGGENVDIPYGEGGGADDERDYAPFGPRPSPRILPGGLTGDQLARFHELAHAFSTAVYRAYEMAWRQQRNAPGSEPVVSALQTLYHTAFDVHQRADDNAIDPREVRPIVERLLAEARQVDQTLRSRQVLPQLRDPWARAVEIANEMAVLLR